MFLFRGLMKYKCSLEGPPITDTRRQRLLGISCISMSTTIALALTCCDGNCNRVKHENIFVVRHTIQNHDGQSGAGASQGRIYIRSCCMCFIYGLVILIQVGPWSAARVVDLQRQYPPTCSLVSTLISKSKNEADKSFDG
jgi:hypothetical protein